MKYFHLTTPQQNIWNLQKYYGHSAIANLCGAIFFQEKRSGTLLRKAICQFIRNQSGIRLRFCEMEEPMQYVSEEIIETVEVIAFENRNKFDRYAEDFAKEPIGLTEQPMYRFVIFHLEEENRSGILVVLSHLISDAWTFGLMANQLDAAYRNLAGEDDKPLLKGDYLSFVKSEEHYLQSERCRKDKSYWEKKYAVRPEACHVKGYMMPTAEAGAKRITKRLPDDLEAGLLAYCKKHSVTQAVLFETVLAVYLFHLNTDRSSVTFGVPVLNRGNAKEKEIAGMFVSTVPLTVRVAGETEILQLARQITKEHMELFRHQKYSYSEILRFLREKQDFAGSLYDVMISYQNARTKTGAETKWYSNGCSEAPLLIHIDNRDDSACHTINVDYQTAAFGEEKEAAYVIARLEYILEQIVDHDIKKVCDIRIVSPKEYQQIVYEFNDTYVDYPREKCVHELFMEQAAKTPDRIALVFEEKKFTYRELDKMSNSLAHFLREKGVGPNDVVPIIARRSWHVIVAMLGILKAGGGYMPIDPDYPSERKEFMLSDMQVKFILTYSCKYNGKYRVIDLDGLDYSKNRGEVKNYNSSSDICYVIYTSGSSGYPKAVCINHANLVNFVNINVKNSYQKEMVESCNTVLADTKFIFDISIFEIFLPLLNGLCIILAKETMDTEYLAQLIERHQADVLHITPTKLMTFMHSQNFRKSITILNVLMVGAEVFNRNLYQILSQYTNASIYNGYGPTETTIGSCFKRVSEKQLQYTNDFLPNITIGHPIANTQIYILDPDNHPLPIGVPGELCIAGEGVGPGYLNRPKLTVEKFVANPFATPENHHGRVMYRTGDLARWRCDGEIEYLGRIDTQVKIRGLRIELEEIESVMAEYSGIGLVAAAAKRDRDGRQYLVACYTADHEIDEKELRSHLSKKLPKYMIPNYFMKLDEMPMTASGKTDRKNLPAPDFSAQTREYIAPASEREQVLCCLIEELLHIKPVGVTDDFFELGGDSLTAIELLAKAHDKGIDFAMQKLFDYPTVRLLCEQIESKESIKVRYESSDFTKYQRLFAENRIDEYFIPEKKSLGNVLLTGATGFLGAHVLAQLLQEENGKIYCLVRENKNEGAKKRLRDTLQYYFGDSCAAEGRIIPIPGDIEREELAENMPKDVQTVIHAAATVRHYGSYAYFNRVNAEGTRHVAAYAHKVGAKLIHISTLSVSGNSMADEYAVYRSKEEKFFDETSFYIGQPLDNVYVHSKFEAERAVYDAMSGGLDAKVIRVGNLTNRASDYKFQSNYRQNAFLSRVKAILEFGMFPDYLMPLYSEFSPIDKTAEGVVKIAQYAGSQTVFHLNSNRPIYFDRLLEVVRQLGITMQVVDGASFYQALRKTIRDRVSAYIFEALENDMDEQGRLVYDSNIHIENDFTVWFLKKVGFAWDETDLEYIRGYLNYFRGIGYLLV